MPCIVPNCPAVSVDGAPCAVHRFARLAKGIQFDGKTWTALACATCRRKLRPDDWIHDEPGVPPRHIHCDPPVPRVHKRDEAKPLFDVIAE